jgi:colanic acid biosynthesis glycosyl transferase WcaI
VSSISEGMVHKVQDKAGKNTILFPNWADIKQFYPVESRMSLKKEFGFNELDKIILYSGAIGEKQGLESIIYAARTYKDNKELKFVICGSGPYREKLQALADNLKLSNVIFLPLQPLHKFNQFLNIADVHLVIQRANASDLVMPSKLTNILAVGGLALITTNKGAGLHTLIEKHNMGLLVEAENQQALIAGIEKVINGDLAGMTRNARMYAEEYLSIDQVMSSFESKIQSLLLPESVSKTANASKISTSNPNYFPKQNIGHILSSQGTSLNQSNQ